MSQMKSFYWQLQNDRDLEACMLPDIVEYNAIMNDIADDQHRRMIEEMDEEATFPLLWFFILLNDYISQTTCIRQYSCHYCHFVILHVDATIGVIINLVAETISMPFFLKTKSWDVVFMLSFMITIGLSKLVGLIVSNALVQPIVNFLG